MNYSPSPELQAKKEPETQEITFKDSIFFILRYTFAHIVLTTLCAVAMTLWYSNGYTRSNSLYLTSFVFSLIGATLSIFILITRALCTHPDSEIFIHLTVKDKFHKELLTSILTILWFNNNRIISLNICFLICDFVLNPTTQYFLPLFDLTQ